MSFNLEISKQTQEITFPKKNINVSHPPLYFNKTHLVVCSYQKLLGVFLDKKLSFQHHIKEKIAKASEGIGVIKKLDNVLTINALLTIYKSFVRPHLNYGDILYHEPSNESMNSKLESVQCSAALVITGAIKGTSRSKLYKELAPESLKSIKTLRRLFSFHKIISTGLPIYLFNLISKSTHGYQTRTSGNIPTKQCRTDTFKHSFFHWTVITWSKIHPEIQNASLTVFKKHLLKQIRPVPHSVYNICSPNGLKLLTRIRLCLSHLNEQRFNHNCNKPLCTCVLMFNELCEVDVDLPNLLMRN